MLSVYLLQSCAVSCIGCAWKLFIFTAVFERSVVRPPHSSGQGILGLTLVIKSTKMLSWVNFLLLLCCLSLLISAEEEITPPHTKCVSTFVKYTSSPFEQKWAENVVKWQRTVCDHMSNSEMDWWLKNVTALMADNDGSAVITDSEAPPPKDWSWVFPVFTYRRVCHHKDDGTSVTDYVHIPIEPTAGLARDPRKCWDPMSSNFTQSKAYLLPLSYKAATVSAMKSYNPHKSHTEQGATTYLFDAGATVAGLQRSTATGWSGTEWIYDWYEKRGIAFDQVYAWEPTKQTVNTAALKPGLAKALQFNNVGITAGRNDEHNPLARIRALCKPRDIVVFKLDIDSPMEMLVVKQLLTSRELLGLVDEFYFEHHVRNDVMKMHGLGGNDPTRDLKTWYDMVLPARQKGLHMHFWP